jgi:hypothetical protein
MGNSTSTSKQEEKKQEEIIESKNVVDTPTNETTEPNKNLEKIMPNNTSNEKPKEEQDTTDILAGITEIEEKKAEAQEQKPEEQKGGSKKKIPMLGGFKVNSNLSETSDNIFNGLENKTERKRYTKYDLFKILRDLDVDTEAPQQGGNPDGNPDSDNDDKSSLNDDKSMEHIKNIILKELETLKTNKSQQLGGSGCGCDGSGDKKNSRKLSSKLNLNNVIIDDSETKQLGGTVIIDASSSSTTSDESESSSSELGKAKKSKSSKSLKSSKKSKSKYSSKSKKIQKQESSDSDSHFQIDTSESEFGDGKEQTSNGESDEKSESEKRKPREEPKEETDSEEGLSIFPFNSSDVKSSQSIKNYRMLRRKI